MKSANLVYSQMHHLQVICRIQNQRQEVCWAHLDHIRLFPSHGCARSKPQFLTAVPSLKLFRLTQVYVWMVYQLSSFGTACWAFCLVKQPLETLCVTNARESFRLIHILTNCAFESVDHVPSNTPNCPHSAQLYIFEDNAAVIPMINKGRSLILRLGTRTHRVD